MSRKFLAFDGKGKFLGFLGEKRIKNYKVYEGLSLEGKVVLINGADVARVVPYSVQALARLNFPETKD